jgi:DeoR family transcriptional regulator, fructose operon transcriptional repressor
LSVLAEERKLVILEWLHKEGKVMVIPLSEHLEVSPETIRRDLFVLEKEGKLKRVYGGAIKPTFLNDEAPYTIRQSIHPEEKRAIGWRAAELIQDGSTIVIDVGTTTLELAQAIQGKKRLTILTNSIPVASTLLESISRGVFTGRVIILGGEVNPEQRSISGTLCEQMTAQFHVDQAFLSVGGISLANGITDFDFNEAAVSKVFAAAAQEVIVLADHSKLGITTFARMIPLEQVDIIISSTEAPSEWTQEIGRCGVLWIDAYKMDIEELKRNV